MSGAGAAPSGAASSAVQGVYPPWQEPEAALTWFQLPEGYAVFSRVEDIGTKRYGFRAGTLALLIKAGTRSEVVRAPAISVIPHSPRWLLGLINLRSNLVPVFNLAGVCASGDASVPERATVLVLGAGEKAVGIPIEALPVSLSDLKKIPQLPSLPNALSGSVGTAYVANGEVWLEFSHEEFFSSLKRSGESGHR